VVFTDSARSGWRIIHQQFNLRARLLSRSPIRRPHASNAACARNTNRPACFVESNFPYGYDEIAPGYDFLRPLEGGLIRVRALLHTYSPNAGRFEKCALFASAVLTTSTTLTFRREALLLISLLYQTVLAERWSWRTSGGYTHEIPLFAPCSRLRLWNSRSPQFARERFGALLSR